MTTDSLDAANLRPLRMGEILDLSLQMTLEIIPQLLVLAFFISVFEQLNLVLPQEYAWTHFGLSLFVFGLPFALTLVVTLAASTRRMNLQPSIWKVLRQFPVWRFIGSIILSFWVALVAAFLMIFLIAPGIVYGMNRLLAVTIYLVEGHSMRESVWRSKFLMTRGRWYSPSSPMMRVSVVMFVLVVILASLSLRYGAEEYFGWGETFSSTGAFIFEVLFGAFAQLLTAFSAIVYVNFYFDLRARYEGLDLLTDLENIDQKLVAAGHA